MPEVEPDAVAELPLGREDRARGDADALLQRFANPALQHRLIQIAMDGSQKLPQRWLETLAIHQARGQQCPAILTGIAGWIQHLRGANGPVDDPRGAALCAAASGANAAAALFGPGGLMASAWQPGPAEIAAIATQLD